MEDDVLGGHAVAERAVDLDAHVERTRLEERLRREDVLDLGRANAERERTERAVRARVTVAADDGRAREGEALLGADDL